MRRDNKMITEVIKEWSYDNKYRLCLYLIVVFFGVTLSFWIIPSLTSKLINSIHNENTTQKVVLLLIAGYASVVFADMTKRFVEDTFVPDFNKRIRDKIYEYVISSYSADRDIELGKLLNILSYLPYSIRNIMLDILRVYIPYGIAAIVLIAYFFKLDKRIGVIQLTTFVLFCAIILLNTRTCIHKSNVAMDQYLEISEQAKDRISNIEAVYAAKQEKYEIENYAELNERNTVIHRDALRNNWYFRVYEEILIIGSFALFNYILFKSKGIDKKTKIALFVAENYYFLKILNQTQSNIVSILTNIGEAQAQIEYLKEISIMNPDINLKPKGKKKDSNLALNISKLNFRYDEESPWIFEDLNLQIRHGEKIYLKGSSGSGKSTFLKLLLRSLDQNSGMIKIYGNTNKARIRKEIQIVDQRTNLFNDSVLENIKYGNNATTKQIEIVIEKMNTDIFKNLKDGLMTEVGVDGSNVSGGQRQAIVLLRSRFSKSRLLLLDEPISGIDEENVDIILKLIMQISENKTVIAISHNPRLKEITDREITLTKNKTDEIIQHSFSTI